MIRAMRKKDVDAAAKLEARIFSQPWSRQGFLDSLCLENTVFLVAEEEGELSGYIGMYTAVDEGEIVNVAVAPEKRGRGIGMMLMQKMKRAAQEGNIKRIVLEVRVSNQAAIRLYEKNGFISCGVRKNFYELPREDACIMIYGQ